MLENVETQRLELNKPVDERFIRKNSNANGSRVSGEYVRQMLNHIFGPDNWSHMVLSGPDLVRLNAGGAYVKTVVRLTVRFANGQQAVHEDVGVTVLSTGGRKDMESIDPEPFEKALKCAVTDGLKACAGHLGICFRLVDDLIHERPQRESYPDGQVSSRYPQVETDGVIVEDRSLSPAQVAAKS